MISSMSEMLLIIGSILLVEGAMIRPLLLAFLSMLVFEGVVFAESGPVFSDTGPEAEAYGASRGYPVPPFEYPPGRGQDIMVGTYSHFDKVRPVRPVEKPATPSVLKRAAEEIAPVYHYDGRQKAIGDYLDAHPVTGLLIARGDTILLEHYQYARTDKDRFLSQSMVKTLTGLLVGNRRYGSNLCAGIGGNCIRRYAVARSTSHVVRRRFCRKNLPVRR